MTAIVEVQHEEEVRRALKVDSEVLLINNRDLSTFEIDLSTSARLAAQVPSSANVKLIAASGIQTRRDIDQLLPVCRNFLIGSALMQSENLDSKLAELKGEATSVLEQS